MVLKIPLLFCAMLLLFFPLYSQTLSENHPKEISAQIVAKGYENVTVNRRNDTLFIGLENRVWRFEPRAVAEILKVVMPAIDSNAVVAITLLHTGIPVTTVIVGRKRYESLVAGRLQATGFADSVVAVLSDRAYRNSREYLHPVNPSFNKLDIVVIPQLKFQFGNFIHPLELQFNVAPAVQISFLKGMSFTAQVIFPIYNNIIGDPEGNTIRPGVVLLSQTFRLPYQFFTTVNAGYFTRNRYGINGDVYKFLFNGKMAVHATIGYTGQMQVLEGKFAYTNLNAFTWFCDASWRFSKYDLTVRAGYGRFIDHDQGWRVDIGRQFGEVSIGFFAMQTGGVMNGGFNFIVPLPPRKYGTRNRIRIRPASYVPWEYRAKGLPSYGRTFSSGQGTEQLIQDMNPDFIRTQLGKQILFH
jgi:hypothetical protein